MAKAALKRINLMLEEGKLRRLRRQNRARSNSEAVRMAIDRDLAITGIQNALRGLQRIGGVEDVFNRAPVRSK